MKFYKFFLILVACVILAGSAKAEKYIAARDVKLMEEHDGKGHVITTIKKNAILDVTEVDDVWWKVTYNGREGYVKGKYLREASPEATVQTPSPPQEPSGLPFNINTDVIVGVLMTALLLAVIVRQTMNYMARKKAKAEYVPVVKTISVTNWYQCKNCRVSIKKDSEPGIAGCSQSLRHVWVNLGEIGNLKYICKGCSTIITVKSEPLDTACPNEGQHVWKKI